MGERQPMTDLMAWNADATRLPYRMIRTICAGSSSTMISRKAALLSRASLSSWATSECPSSPWHGARPCRAMALNLQDPPSDGHRGNLSAHNGGHNAGIVSEPGRGGRSFQLMTKKPDDQYLDPQTFLLGGEFTVKEGSCGPLPITGGLGYKIPSVGRLDLFLVANQCSWVGRYEVTSLATLSRKGFVF